MAVNSMALVFLFILSLGLNGQQEDVPTFLTDQEVTSCCFLTDELFLTASSNGELSVWEVRTGALSKKYQLGNAAVTNLSSIPGGKRVVALVENSRLIEFDLGKEKITTTIDLPYTAYRVVPGPDGKWVVIGCSDHKVRVLEMASGKERGRLDASFGSPEPFSIDISISSDGKLIAVAFGPIRRNGEKTHVWDAVTFKHLFEYGERNAEKVTVAFSPTKSSLLALPGKERSVCVWDLQKEEKPRVLANLAAPPFCLRYSPNGKYLVAAPIGSPVVVLQVSDGKLVYRLPIQAGWDAVSFSPASTLLAVTDARRVLIWDLDAGKIFAPIEKKSKR
jgi:WD40 repeat protein